MAQPVWHATASVLYDGNGIITVFQNQVPNSKGRAVIHSEELPPESQANYRPSRRPITARVTDQLPPESQTNYRPRAGAHALVSRGRRL